MDTRHHQPVRWLVPPHPYPLPQGEGTASEDLFFANASAANLTLGDSNKRRTILPLPWGEGQGEGEQNLAYPTDLSVSQRAENRLIRRRYATQGHFICNGRGPKPTATFVVSLRETSSNVQTIRAASSRPALDVESFPQIDSDHNSKNVPGISIGPRLWSSAFSQEGADR